MRRSATRSCNSVALETPRAVPLSLCPRLCTRTPTKPQLPPSISDSPYCFLLAGMHSRCSLCSNCVLATPVPPAFSISSCSPRWPSAPRSPSLLFFHSHLHLVNVTCNRQTRAEVEHASTRQSRAGTGGGAQHGTARGAQASLGPLNRPRLTCSEFMRIIGSFRAAGRPS